MNASWSGRSDGWRYLVARWDGYDAEQPIIEGEAPLTGVTMTDVLSGPPTLQATIDPFRFHRKAPDGKPTYLDYSSMIFAEQDGEIRGGGMLIDSAFDGTSYGLTVAGFSALPQGHAYIGDGEYHVDIDICDAFRRCWQYVQFGQSPPAFLALEVDSETKSGIKIGTELKQVDFTTDSGEQVSFEAGPWKLAWHTMDDLGREMDDLAGQGFDWIERHAWRRDSEYNIVYRTPIRHTLDLYVPHRRRRRGTTVRFVVGENVFEMPSLDRDSENYASIVQGMGAGEGASRVREIQGGADPLGRWPKAKTVEDSSLRSKSAVRRLAQTELSNSRGDWEVTTLNIRNSPSADIATLEPGDEVLLMGEIGGVEYDNWVRIVSVTRAPDQPDRASLQVERWDKSS